MFWMRREFGALVAANNELKLSCFVKTLFHYAKKNGVLLKVILSSINMF